MKEKPQVTEVAPGVHRIVTALGSRINAVYLLCGSRRSLLVDTTTSESAEAVLDACEDLGAGHPSWVMTTHSDWDHSAGNGLIRQRSPDSQLMCHERDREMIENIDLMINDRYGEFAHDHGFDETDEAKATIRQETALAEMDISLSGGEIINLGDGWRVEVMHTPGHSLGSISVYDPRSDALIAGDAVLGSAVPLANGAPAFPPTYRYIDDYVATIERINMMNPSLLLTSHYPIFSGPSVKEFLAESLKFTDRVETKLVDSLRDAGQPVGLLEVVKATSADLGNWPPESAPYLLFPMVGHLDRLICKGAVTASSGNDEGITLYRWMGGNDA